MARRLEVRGAIGDVPQDVADRLARPGSTPTRVLHRSAKGILAASGELQTWTSKGVTGWYWGQSIQPATTIGHWRDVARQAGSAGFCVDDRGWPTLHADRSGAVPLFLRRTREYMLFGSSIDLLVDAVGGPLHVDEAAWAEILAGGMVMSDRTPFEEIRRLRAGGWCEATEHGVTKEATVVPFSPEGRRRGDDAAASELVHRMHAVVNRTRGESLTVPLSGGWDSRLLAAVVAGDERAVQTVTASDEYGRDEEPDWAAQVADRLGLPNERLQPPHDWWHAFVTSVAAQEFLTSKNHWLLPVARAVAERPGTLLDGLAGDVLVKMNLPAWLAEASGTAVVDGLRSRFAPALLPTEMLDPALASHLDELVSARFDGCWTDVKDHPAALHLYNYYLRTPTGVGLCPMMLLAASAPVVLPFLAEEVVDFALSVDPRDKRDGQWYRAVMDRLQDGLAEIPSTNDTKPMRRTRRRVDLAPDALGGITAALLHESVRRAPGPRLRAAMANGSILDARHVPDQRVVRGLAVYSLWAQRYEHRLANPNFPGSAPPDARRRTTRHRVAPSASAPADQDWLRVQELPPSTVLTLDRRGEIDADPAYHPGASSQELRTVSIVGGPATLGQLEAAVDAAAELLEPDGRVLLSLALRDTPGDHFAPGMMAVCELLSLHLDLVHVQSSARRLRVIATVVADSDRGALGDPRRVAPELLAATMSGLEQRVDVLADSVRQLEREKAELVADASSSPDDVGDPARPPDPREEGEGRPGSQPEESAASWAGRTLRDALRAVWGAGRRGAQRQG